MNNEKEFRIRDKQINFRVTEYEYEEIKKQMEASGKMTFREYLLDMALNGYVIKVDYGELKDLAYEINKIGTNINQIAHKVNSESQVYKTDIEELQADVDLIWRMVRKIFYQLM